MQCPSEDTGSKIGNRFIAPCCQEKYCRCNRNYKENTIWPTRILSAYWIISQKSYGKTNTEPHQLATSFEEIHEGLQLMQILPIKTQSTMSTGQRNKEENSFATLSANEDFLCTSKASETVSQKLSWLTCKNPQREETSRQGQTIQSGGGFSV